MHVLFIGIWMTVSDYNTNPTVRGVAKAMCLGGPRLAFADKVGVAKAWYGCGFGMGYDNDLIFL
jgi:hypothetical protein